MISRPCQDPSPVVLQKSCGGPLLQRSGFEPFQVSPTYKWSPMGEFSTDYSTTVCRNLMSFLQTPIKTSNPMIGCIKYTRNTSNTCITSNTMLVMKVIQIQGVFFRKVLSMELVPLNRIKTPSTLVPPKATRGGKNNQNRRFLTFQ